MPERIAGLLPPASFRLGYLFVIGAHVQAVAHDVGVEPRGSLTAEVVTDALDPDDWALWWTLTLGAV